MSRSGYAGWAVFWFAALLALSLSPYEIKTHLHTRGHLHQAGHVAAFALLSFLLCKIGRNRILGVAIALVTAYGMEWLEHSVYHNSLEWRDVGFDAVGALLGCLFGMLVAP